MIGLLTTIATLLNTVLGMFGGDKKAAEAAERKASDALTREQKKTMDAVRVRRAAERRIAERDGVYDPDRPYRRRK